MSASVLVVDSDLLVLKSLRGVLTNAGYDVTTYSSATDFFAAAFPSAPRCVVLDVDMPGMSGLEAQRHLLRSSESVPVIFTTGVRDVPTAVEALKAGAVDFLLKPFGEGVLLAAVARAVQRSIVLAKGQQAVSRACRLLSSLTRRQREVCQLVADGLTSREIAQRLGTAQCTISLHRARVMTKLRVRSVAEVVRVVVLASREAES
jgi:FixJ family two-component response regulator